MPADLRSARVYVTYFGEEVNKADVLDALKLEAKFLQGELAHKLKLRYCPRVSFEWDMGYESSLKIDKILHDLAAPTKSDEDEA